MRIAQRFSVGKKVWHSLSPEGTVETGTIPRPSLRDYTFSAVDPNPESFRGWAIVECPAGTREVRRNGKAIHLQIQVALGWKACPARCAAAEPLTALRFLVRIV
jgi:hypothetical protein